MEYFQVMQTPLGKVTLLSDGQSFLGCWFENQKHFGGKYDLTKAEESDTLVLQKAKQWLTDYFAGKAPDIATLPIKLKVTPFQQQVLQTLQQLPYGHTVTYQQICYLITDDEQRAKNLSRAVGHAIGANPFMIFIPCHRVVGSDGSLTGYAGGLARKKALLTLEEADFQE
ncbi:methylated-DNA--[protein]-cysteine S-methyltransferase [Weissella paramesenteroides]|uniref:methylated-DNA--[protein]-cysteine S-methyltransferase n=1 Tax=Weissella paramesenteroides TaxID=1249 RepID=UPI00103C722D|nr:methylated-DNA--[protein]-cysteine S-methyltransferase [Weissella paramesenteroides]RZQ57655.1 methylated-DNA--[protein]-cysteine S-methyltransferase [Weissella paramesenteroides]